jgi:hypothetical protein
MGVVAITMMTNLLGIGFYGAAIYYSSVDVFAQTLVSFACSLIGINCVTAVIVMYSLKKSALAKFSKKQKVPVQVLVDTNEHGKDDGVKSSDAPLGANQQATELKTIVLPRNQI